MASNQPHGVCYWTFMDYTVYIVQPSMEVEGTITSQAIWPMTIELA